MILPNAQGSLEADSRLKSGAQDSSQKLPVTIVSSLGAWVPGCRASAWRSRSAPAHQCAGQFMGLRASVSAGWLGARSRWGPVGLSEPGGRRANMSS